MIKRIMSLNIDEIVLIAVIAVSVIGVYTAIYPSHRTEYSCIDGIKHRQIVSLSTGNKSYPTPVRNWIGDPIECSKLSANT